jgi:hypothetical protein
MKRFLFITGALWLLVLGALPLMAQVSESSPDPMIQVDRLEHDFGELRQGEVRKTSFTVSNVGGAPLLIRQVLSTCDCTAVILDSRLIKPGESRVMQVTLDTHKKRGNQDKPIVIKTNDPVTPEIRVIIKADIRVYVEIRPHRIDLARLTPGEHSRAIAMIDNNSSRGVRLIDVDSSRPEIKGTLSGTYIRPGQNVVLTVTLTVPSKVGNRFSGRLRIRTDHPDYPVLTLPVKVVVMGGETRLPEVKTRLHGPSH